MTAPLFSHRGKLCLENEDRNSKNICMVFPEKALGTQRAPLLSHFSSAMQECTMNALSLPVAGLIAHQSHRNPTPPQRPHSPRCPPHQHNTAGADTSSSHCICSPANAMLNYLSPLKYLTFLPLGKPPRPSWLVLVFRKEAREMHTMSFPFALKMECSTFTVQDQCNKQELLLETVC